ncbi:MAG: hypothetical protein LUC45_07495 [Paraprevotella sp.]|nr:hypothetical protein [Paraprevotella sp.]
MTSPKTTPSPATSQDALAHIRMRKAQISKQLKESTNYIKMETNRMFAPPPEATSKFGTFMNMVDQGIAVYDGVMMGLRVARNLRRLFGRC